MKRSWDAGCEARKLPLCPPAPAHPLPFNGFCRANEDLENLIVNSSLISCENENFFRFISPSLESVLIGSIVMVTLILLFRIILLFLDEELSKYSTLTTKLVEVHNYLAALVICTSQPATSSRYLPNEY